MMPDFVSADIRLDCPKNDFMDIYGCSVNFMPSKQLHPSFIADIFMRARESSLMSAYPRKRSAMKFNRSAYETIRNF